MFDYLATAELLGLNVFLGSFSEHTKFGRSVINHLAVYEGWLKS